MAGGENHGGGGHAAAGHEAGHVLSEGESPAVKKKISRPLADLFLRPLP